MTDLPPEISSEKLIAATGVWRFTRHLYVMAPTRTRGWLFSASAFGWLIEGCTTWNIRGRHSGGYGFGRIWIGRRTYAR